MPSFAMKRKVLVKVRKKKQVGIASNNPSITAPIPLLTLNDSNSHKNGISNILRRLPRGPLGSGSNGATPPHKISKAGELEKVLLAFRFMNLAKEDVILLQEMFKKWKLFTKGPSHQYTNRQISFILSSLNPNQIDELVDVTSRELCNVPSTNTKLKLVLIPDTVVDAVSMWKDIITRLKGDVTEANPGVGEEGIIVVTISQLARALGVFPKTKGTITQFIRSLPFLTFGIDTAEKGSSGDVTTKKVEESPSQGLKMGKSKMEFEYLMMNGLISKIEALNRSKPLLGLLQRWRMGSKSHLKRLSNQQIYYKLSNLTSEQTPEMINKYVVDPATATRTAFSNAGVSISPFDTLASKLRDRLVKEIREEVEKSNQGAEEELVIAKSIARIARVFGLFRTPMTLVNLTYSLPFLVKQQNASEIDNKMIQQSETIKHSTGPAIGSGTNNLQEVALNEKVKEEVDIGDKRDIQPGEASWQDLDSESSEIASRESAEPSGETVDVENLQAMPLERALEWLHQEMEKEGPVNTLPTLKRSLSSDFHGSRSVAVASSVHETGTSENGLVEWHKLFRWCEKLSQKIGSGAKKNRKEVNSPPQGTPGGLTSPIEISKATAIPLNKVQPVQLQVQRRRALSCSDLGHALWIKEQKPCFVPATQPPIVSDGAQIDTTTTVNTSVSAEEQITEEQDSESDAEGSSPSKPPSKLEKGKGREVEPLISTSVSQTNSITTSSSSRTIETTTTAPDKNRSVTLLKHYGHLNKTVKSSSAIEENGQLIYLIAFPNDVITLREGKRWGYESRYTMTKDVPSGKCLTMVVDEDHLLCSINGKKGTWRTIKEWDACPPSPHGWLGFKSCKGAKLNKSRDPTPPPNSPPPSENSSKVSVDVSPSTSTPVLQEPTPWTSVIGNIAGPSRLGLQLETTPSSLGLDVNTGSSPSRELLHSKKVKQRLPAPGLVYPHSFNGVSSLARLPLQRTLRANRASDRAAIGEKAIPLKLELVKTPLEIETENRAAEERAIAELEVATQILQPGKVVDPKPAAWLSSSNERRFSCPFIAAISVLGLPHEQDAIVGHLLLLLHQIDTHYGAQAPDILARQLEVSKKATTQLIRVALMSCGLSQQSWDVLTKATSGGSDSKAFEELKANLPPPSQLRTRAALLKKQILFCAVANGWTQDVKAVVKAGLWVLESFIEETEGGPTSPGLLVEVESIELESDGEVSAKTSKAKDARKRKKSAEDASAQRLILSMGVRGLTEDEMDFADDSA